MRRIHFLVLVLSLLAVPVVFAETVEQCMINCPPGNNSCSQCCMTQFNAASAPCFDACNTTDMQCLIAAGKDCNAKFSDPYQEATCITQARNTCWLSYISCRRACNPDIKGGCPGEVPPQKCPYNCQMWNPASQSCVGPQMNQC
jgi:hypothetical protein